MTPATADRVPPLVWLCAIVGALAIYALPGAFAQALGFQKPFNPNAATITQLREHIKAGRTM